MPTSIGHEPLECAWSTLHGAETLNATAARDEKSIVGTMTAIAGPLH
jgi:hypothetical protein